MMLIQSATASGFTAAMCRLGLSALFSVQHMGNGEAVAAAAAADCSDWLALLVWRRTVVLGPSPRLTHLCV